VRLPSASSFWSRLLEFPAVVPFEFQPLVSQFKKLQLNNHRISYDVTKFLDKNVTWELLSQRCAHAMFVKESPEWRNWQTRWTQKRRSAAFQTSSQILKITQGLSGHRARQFQTCALLLTLAHRWVTDK
jgi:hypothetical protein